MANETSTVVVAVTAWDIMVMLREHATRLCDAQYTVDIKEISRRIHELAEKLP